MGEVIEIDDPFVYSVNSDTDEIEAVGWHKKSEYLYINLSGEVSSIRTLTKIPAHELRQLMVMWLALKYPEILALDKKAREDSIRDSTKIDISPINR